MEEIAIAGEGSAGEMGSASITLGRIGAETGIGRMITLSIIGVDEIDQGPRCHQGLGGGRNLPTAIDEIHAYAYVDKTAGR